MKKHLFVIVALLGVNIPFFIDCSLLDDLNSQSNWTESMLILRFLEETIWLMPQKNSCKNHTPEALMIITLNTLRVVYVLFIMV